MTSARANETSNWLSVVSDERARGWTGDIDVDAPDFEAIPRDKTGARAAAVLSLYESDLTNRPVMQCVEWVVSEMGLSKKSKQFVSSLTTGVEERRTELDRRLNRYSKRRTMQEASPVVRNVLRTALVELEMYPKTRTAVIINEAVKLSQMFDAEGSGRFVNGVLGAIVRDSGREDGTA
ncbi:MAG: transcription antitermination factor NusB [Chloroflexi bacterium]|nr:transcription antitermination factor NusB [Chloroflexota bacterium]